MTKISPKLRLKMDGLLDDKFIADFFDENLKIFFKNAEKIKKIEKKIYKDIRGDYDYTLIIEFIIQIVFSDKQICEKSVFCKAHSDEKKNKSIYYMEILYKNGFNEGAYKVPRPLRYVPELRAGFYEGVQGNNLLYYLKHRDYDKIEQAVKDAAAWINKLHSINPEKFNSHEPRFTYIRDNYPPIEKVLRDMEKNYPRLHKVFKPLYVKTEKYEEKLIDHIVKSKRAKIIYADYHPENIIIPRYTREGIAVIDFTDLSLGDPYRDVGTFMEQVEFMSRKYMPASKAKKWSDIFIKEYMAKGKEKPTKDNFKRINLYRLWSCLRNIIHFYYKEDPEQVIWGLVDDAKGYLDIIKK
ncbi:MAG: aminoglycoside phosphotransferase family protein [bacterium]